MRIARYDVPCPQCGVGRVVARDVPSQASLNGFVTPEGRKPVPAGDRWRYLVESDCASCGAGSAELGEVLTERGLPADRRDVS